MTTKRERFFSEVERYKTRYRRFSTECMVGANHRVAALRMWVQSSPVVAFLLLTFLISWSIWGAARILLPGAGPGLRYTVHTAGLFGPTMAALLLSGFLYGRRGTIGLLRQITRWRVGARWYIFALFSTLGIGLAAIGAHTLIVGVNPPLNLNVFLPQLLSAGLPEEYGWRGFALPHLLKSRSALASSLVIALFWVLWHIPISPMLNNPALAGMFMLEVMPVAILFSWLFINSRGSILLVVLYHFVYNAVVFVLNIPSSISLWGIYVGMNWVLAGLIVAQCGASRLSRQGCLESAFR